MGLGKTIKYCIFGKKDPDKTGRFKVIDLEENITKLSSVYVEITAYEEIKHAHGDSAVKNIGDLTRKKLTGKDAYSVIKGFIADIDDFNWEYTYADLVFRRIKKRKKKKEKNLLNITILRDVMFNIQVEGELEETIISY